MDKPRHPHVIRTWTVERTRQPIHNLPTTSKREVSRPAIPRPHAKPAVPHEEVPEKP